MTRRRREPQNSTLSFMDCICCGFGAILLLFILTAKRQVTLNSDETVQRAEAVDSLQAAIRAAEEQDRELQLELASLGTASTPEGPDSEELAARQADLSASLQDLEEAINTLRAASESTDEPAAMDRPSADRQYLAGLQLKGPRVLILLENSGSMVGETATEALQILRTGNGLDAPKWKRAKAAVRSVLAALPKGNQAAVFNFAESPEALSGGTTPWFDPYENTALLSFLGRLDALEAGGGADLARALHHIAQLEPSPNSILLISDGLPTAPSSAGSLSESDRVGLLRRAMAVQPNVPFNTLLLPFEGDPAAAGLFWQMTGRTLGVTIVPDADWPPVN